MKAADVKAILIYKFSELRGHYFYALEYGHVGEDTYENLYAFETRRARYLWCASASNVDRDEITARQAARFMRG